MLTKKEAESKYHVVKWDDSEPKEKDVTFKKAPSQKTETKNNWANVGLALGLISIFFASIGIIPLSGIIVNIVGINKSKNMNGIGKTKAIIGLVLSSLYMLVNMYIYGHLVF